MNKRCLYHLMLLALILFLINAFSFLAIAKKQTIKQGVYKGGFHYELSNKEITITEYTGSAKKIKIPDKIKGYKVTIIADSAFHSCSTIRELILPKYLRYISETAFFNCTKLKKVTFPKAPKNIIVIDDYAFAGCAFTELLIPEKIRLCDCTFINCKKLKNLSFAKGFNGIGGEGIFSGCESLSTVSVSASVDHGINGRTFENCPHLNKIGIVKSNKTYRIVNGIVFDKKMTSLFFCPIGLNLKTYSVPDSVTILADNAFCECKNLESIDLNNTAEIWGSVFFGCTELKSITIPSTVKSIGDCAFGNCTSLKTMTIDAEKIIISASAFNKDKDLTLLINTGSEVEEYAKQYGLKYEYQ